MKPFLALRVALLCSFVAASLKGQATLRAEASGRGSSEIHLSVPQSDAKPLSIKVDYGQPHLRGRTLHTDSLVPYDKPWRMGANAATRFKTDVDLVLGGATVPRGTYVLFSMPSRSGWKLILQKDVATPEAAYDAAN